MHGGNVGFDGKQMNPGDGKWLEGYHGSSAAFVEAFMCLWGLWREKVEAGTAAEMARVILPQACIPEWLGAHQIPLSLSCMALRASVLQ